MALTTLASGYSEVTLKPLYPEKVAATPAATQGRESKLAPGASMQVAESRPSVAVYNCWLTWGTEVPTTVRKEDHAN